MAERQFSQLVVVGSSAGGIEALSTLVSGLPAEFPAPLVIAQHLDPHRASHLREILSRYSALPVETVEERRALQPGVIYVVPANRHVAITDHEVSLHETHGGPKPSINLLLNSAAEAFGEDLIAVILTGTGSDGADAALRVKQAGGTVVIQNPRTAAFPALPLSLAPMAVDFVADLAEMGALLNALLTGAYVPAGANEETALRTLMDQMRERFDIDFSSYKRLTIMRRLSRRMMAAHTETIDDYLRYLWTHPEEYQHLVSSFLIKVTEFFRDPQLYDYLREHVLPELIGEARSHGHELRIWSAGCSTGEEAYSLAVLVAEALGDELDGFNVRIFATDLDADAVEYARRGIYPRSAVSGVPPDLLQRYFVEMDNHFEIRKNVLSLMVFGQHDLAERAPFPRIDLLVCRNVLIYFSAEMQRHVLQLFAFSLREGGYLVLGKAESSVPGSESFVPDNAGLKTFVRRGGRILVPSTRIKDTVRIGYLRPSVPHSLGRDSRGSRYLRSDRQENAQDVRWDQALLHLPIGVVIVNSQYDILSINDEARTLMGIHGPALGDDLVHSAQELPSRALRATIDRAVRGGETSTIDEVVVSDVASGEERALHIRCSRYAEDRSETSEVHVAVVVTDVTEQFRVRRALEKAQQEQQGEVERVRTQLQQIIERNEELRQANEDLTTINMELRSTNEEFLVGNEELQAATEEVETLNEELQATNEELETLNEELQATVEELNTTNDDLQARSVELQNLADSLEIERRQTDMERERLAAVLVSMSDAVLVVDREGNPVMTNAAHDRIFGDPRTLVFDGEDGEPLPEDQSPRARAARGESFDAEYTHIREDGSRAYFEVSGRPIRENSDLEGGMLVIRDITERSLRRLQDQFLAAAGHELRTPLTILMGYLQMLDRRQIDADTTRNLVRFALGQSHRMERLIRDLLDAARLQSDHSTLQRERVDLREVLRHAVDAAGVLTEQSIHLHEGRVSIPVDGDPGRLEQVFLNLLLNAMTYAADSPTIEVRLHRSHGQAVVQVEDHGPGIPAEDIAHLFTRFYRGSRAKGAAGNGLGLGLFITREIVTAHGGTIDVDSTVGSGSTFRVHLPLDEDSSEKSNAGSAR